jgi:hypothetical protein
VFHSIYAPAQAQQRLDFFRALPATPIDPVSHTSIYGGDYNCVHVPGRDTRDMPHYASPGATELNDFCVQRGTTDVWLAQSYEQLQLAAGGFTRFSTGSNSASRIDRIYVSAAALDNVSTVEVVPQPDLTDHEGVQVQLSPAVHPKKSNTWRMNLTLLEDPRFINLITTAWEIHLHSYPEGEDLARCWLNFKHKVKRMAVSWGTARAADRRRAVRELQTQLRSSDIDAATRMQLKKSLTVLNSVSQTNHQIISAAAYQSEGDRPTASFYRKVQSGNRSSRIQALTLPDGRVVTTEEHISADLCRFWGGVFGENLELEPTQGEVAARARSLHRIHRQLDDNDSTKLDEPITEQEIDAALSRAKPHKSPGADGLPVEFYKATWEFSGPVLTSLAQSMQLGDALPREMVHANIVLLHKTDAAAPTSGKFRPIALLNADYKLIASALSARLSPLLNKLVDELQTGFVPGRLILENITFNRDLLDYSADEQQPVYMAFLDFEKAFDRVNWRLETR